MTLKRILILAMRLQMHLMHNYLPFHFSGLGAVDFTPSTTKPIVVTHLRHFTFGFDKDEISKLKEHFSFRLDTHSAEVENSDSHKERRRVTVRCHLDQHELVKCLINRALEEIL